ncbi:hypothetical protein [Granulosicoccus antarcticus]|uniref:Outer membrane protein beta-barrel domain-containing protein n=1 Tax=Granulosicoccus antarcticus IMCC3135 TaxID=1192854 RepID=A0A2Z2NVQ8_9GAMM|nr:hypothetical protein [Granulosicoccus antarcticus]ASJ75546.1 hypothetical protein IMCC3135_27460 [Granulosicoccus antarcticus IMCC3135]
MISFKTQSLLTLVFAASLMVSNVQAEFMGLPSGRSASPANMSDLTVELGFMTGDLADNDFQNIGARVNFRLSPEVVLIGDIGVSEFGNRDGNPVGLGLLYFLSRQRISDKLDIAAKASYHTGEYSVGGTDTDLSGLSLEALLSGKNPLADSGLGWYANFGYHLLRVKSGSSDSSNEIGIGGGLVLPIAAGEAYVGVDLIDEVTFGLGFRYFVQ